MGQIQSLAHGGLAHGQFFEQGFVPVWCGEVWPWHDPGWRALENGQFGSALRQLWHDLNGAGPGSNHCDTLAVEIVIVIPGCAVYLFAFEVIKAGDAGPAGVRERTLSHHGGTA